MSEFAVREALEANARERRRLGLLVGSLDEARLARLGPDTMVLHPGPMIRGLEISAAAADSDRSRVLDQVANGVSIRMAILYLLLANEEHK